MFDLSREHRLAAIDAGTIEDLAPVREVRERWILELAWLVLPYSLRAVDGAPISTPLSWSEITPRLDPRAFTLRTLRKRLDAVGDLAAPLLGPGAPDLKGVIARMEP